MTSINEVKNDPNYIPILDHGFVGLVDHMGSDEAVVNAARLSYAKGTKKVNEDRGLIRYLMKHKHTSPFEMCEIKLHIKIPIFVMRQFVRHRTSSLNEMSARYSVLPSEFYVPELHDIAPQSQTNKQGRAGEISLEDKQTIINAIITNNEHTYSMYSELLRDPEYVQDKEISPEMNIWGLEFSDEYPGMTRELSRMVLPVNIYTELYWKQNLHNMFHLLKLRTDPHAQYEIRVLANAMFEHVQKLYPISTEAWIDYVRDSKTMSRMELDLLHKLNNSGFSIGVAWLALRDHEFAGDEKKLAAAHDMSLRELDEFKKQWGLQ